MGKLHLGLNTTVATTVNLTSVEPKVFLDLLEDSMASFDWVEVVEFEAGARASEQAVVHDGKQ